MKIIIIIISFSTLNICWNNRRTPEKHIHWFGLVSGQHVYDIEPSFQIKIPSYSFGLCTLTTGILAALLFAKCNLFSRCSQIMTLRGNWSWLLSASVINASRAQARKMNPNLFSGELKGKNLNRDIVSLKPLGDLSFVFLHPPPFFFFLKLTNKSVWKDSWHISENYMSQALT